MPEVKKHKLDSSYRALEFYEEEQPLILGLIDQREKIADALCKNYLSLVEAYKLAAFIERLKRDPSCSLERIIECPDEDLPKLALYRLRFVRMQKDLGRRHLVNRTGIIRDRINELDIGKPAFRHEALALADLLEVTIDKL